MSDYNFDSIEKMRLEINMEQLICMEIGDTINIFIVYENNSYFSTNAKILYMDNEYIQLEFKDRNNDSIDLKIYTDVIEESDDHQIFNGKAKPAIKYLH